MRCSCPAVNHLAVFALPSDPPTEVACRRKKKKVWQCLESCYMVCSTHTQRRVCNDREEGTWKIIKKRTLTTCTEVSPSQYCRRGGWVSLRSSGFTSSGSPWVIYYLPVEAFYHRAAGGRSWLKAMNVLKLNMTGCGHNCDLLPGMRCLQTHARTHTRQCRGLNPRHSPQYYILFRLSTDQPAQAG